MAKSDKIEINDQKTEKSSKKVQKAHIQKKRKLKRIF